MPGSQQPSQSPSVRGTGKSHHVWLITFTFFPPPQLVGKVTSPWLSSKSSLLLPTAEPRPGQTAQDSAAVPHPSSVSLSPSSRLTSRSWAYLLLTGQVALQIMNSSLCLLQGLLCSVFLLRDALLQSLQANSCCGVHLLPWQDVDSPWALLGLRFHPEQAPPGPGKRNQGSVGSREAGLCESLRWTLTTVDPDSIVGGLNSPSRNCLPSSGRPSNSPPLGLSSAPPLEPPSLCFSLG